MQLLHLLCLLFCFASLVLARPETSPRTAARPIRNRHDSDRRNVGLHRSRKSSPTKKIADGGASGGPPKCQHSAEPKPVRRFLGGTKSTANSTTSTTFVPKATSGKLDGKNTKFSTTLANSYPTRTSTLSSIRHETLSSAARTNPTIMPDPRMYSGDTGTVYGSDMVSSNPGMGKSSLGISGQYGRTSGGNAPLLSHGLSSTPMASMVPNDMASSTTMSSSEAARTSDLDGGSLKYGNSWPLFGLNRNDHTEEQPVKAFYGPNSNRNEFRTQVGRYENVTRPQTANGMMDPILHNLDPSVKYSMGTSPNSADKIPSFNFAGFANTGAVGVPGSIPQEHKDLAQIHPGPSGGLAFPGDIGEPFGTGPTSARQLPGFLGDNAQTITSYTDADWTGFDNKVESSPPVFSATEPRSIPDAQSGYFPMGASEKLVPLYGISCSSDAFSSRPLANQMDGFGGRYFGKTQINANAYSEPPGFQENVQQQDAGSNNDNNNNNNNNDIVGAEEAAASGDVPTSSFSPEKLMDHESLAEPAGGGEFGIIGHRGFASQPRSFIGSHTGYHSEGSFDTALDRHSEHCAETRQSSSVDDTAAAFTSTETICDPIYPADGQLQDKSAPQAQDAVSCSVGPRYDNFEENYESGVLDRYHHQVQSPVRRRSYKAARRSKLNG